MKHTILNIIFFFKRPSFVNRLILLGGSVLLLYYIFVPDLTYGLTVKNPPRLSIEDIRNTPKETLPRYIVVTDAKALRGDLPINLSALGDSLFSSMSEQAKINIGKVLRIQSYNYVTEQRIKKGDTTLSAIFYPVYSTRDSKDSSSAKNLNCYVVIKSVLGN